MRFTAQDKDGAKDMEYVAGTSPSPCVPTCEQCKWTTAALLTLLGFTTTRGADSPTATFSANASPASFPRGFDSPTASTFTSPASTPTDNGAFGNDKKDFALSRALLQSSCEPYSEAACKDAATALQLSLGAEDYAFAADFGSKYPRGCVGVSSGTFEGSAFFGLGGTEAENSADVSDPYYRPANYDCSGVGASMFSSGTNCNAHGCAQIDSIDGCSAAAAELGLVNTDTGSKNKEDQPLGCYWRASKERAYWNKAETTSEECSSDYSCVCNCISGACPAIGSLEQDFVLTVPCS
ncbi:hypothetical protein CYMTET_3398 [Cymbomonas tetramitiformis]|uniref:Uncharacterized protein n=1 Tax=Cymbomonas tetramitiformis TaxID=36881 RepID=A0AAE0H3D6_9CHLO|nr:hypothetical protein CYMTET_3398 [Cymbomonas tetramitiformis]